ncbi:MAG: iron-containing alcohol dehydrogenase family protein [Trichodesmium sp. St19_bin2]|nr:iron-containing alcohol dehydrogenase family protein [Trichodesmium sp. St19_bin2]
MIKSTHISQTATTLLSLNISPTQIIRGKNALAQSGEAIARIGHHPLIVGSPRSLNIILPHLQPLLQIHNLKFTQANYGSDCSETSLTNLSQAVATQKPDLIIGIGGGKALDTAKLLAYQCCLPIITIPTSAATCAAWTALSNIYSDQGAFLYDISLAKCPELLILDYGIIKTGPSRTLVAGIGDAIAKWYEASVSSGHSESTMIISAVQQARVLRDILFQKSTFALEQPGGETWQEVVDATVLLAGLIGSIGGAQCRTVAAHAIHNGLTHLSASHETLHGEKVAYGILVQLRLEEMLQSNQLAATARQQLLKFYNQIGLPKNLNDLGLKEITLSELIHVAEVACHPNSDIHRLPFRVIPEQLVAAMVSKTVPLELEK